MSRKAKLSMTTAKAKIVQLRSAVTITAAADSEGANGPPTFASLAYSGGAVPGYTANPPLPHPYVIDLSGMTATRSPKANLDHIGKQRVGHVTDAVNDGKTLHVTGVLSAATPYRDEVVNSARDGYAWEVSIEGDLGGIRKLAAGKSAVVNGQTITGPMFIVGKSTYTGIAFCSLGADEGNSVTIAAAAASGASKMNEFDQFVESCGADPENITAEHRATLQRAFDAVHKGGTTTTKAGSFDEAAEELRRQQDRERKIQTAALSAMREFPVYAEQIEKLTKAALASATDPRDFELELLRSTRPQAGSFSPFATGASPDNDPEVIEAALCLSAGLPNVEKVFSEKTLSAVDRSGMRHFGLQQIMLRVASANGFACRAGDRVTTGNLREVLQYCFMPATARLSGSSTISLPGILGNVANKEILAGFTEEDQSWRMFSSIKPVNNFHQYTSYRLLDDMRYEEVGPDGEIKHGKLSQQSFTRQAKTYAKQLGLSRTDIINDDLGAFDDIRLRLGMGAALAFNDVYWMRFLAHLGTQFTAALTNYIEGATTNLGVDGVGLEKAVTAFRKMRSPTGDGKKRVGASDTRPSLLLLPPELEFVGDRLHVSANVNTGGAATATSVPDANVHAGKYKPVVQNRLSDPAFDGASSTAFYLFGSLLKPMVVSFLFGKETPTIESTDADFDHLGIRFRGYHDFGADPGEPLAGVMSKGAA